MNKENITIDEHVKNTQKNSADSEITKIKVIIDYESDEHYYKSRNPPASDAILQFL